MLDDLFRILHELILPEGNSLPSSWKEAKKVLCTIGMEYEIIHACPNDCILYQKEYKNCKECPECDTPRYKENMVSKKVPQKAMRYFPLIPCLLHTSDVLTWLSIKFGIPSTGLMMVLCVWPLTLQVIVCGSGVARLSRRSPPCLTWFGYRWDKSFQPCGQGTTLFHLAGSSYELQHSTMDVYEKRAFDSFHANSRSQAANQLKRIHGSIT